MYEIEKREVSTIKNYHGYPGTGKETRWSLLGTVKQLLTTVPRSGFIARRMQKRI